MHFNCTIQELKLPEHPQEDPINGFQLHHTGIKTGEKRPYRSGKQNFNCTIQELKPATEKELSLITQYFNCTIQELKRFLGPTARASELFQLHHTGIKTI